MKCNSELGLRTLSEEELRSINGGSEFSEDFVRGIGWFFGAMAAAGKSFIRHQARIAEAGMVPIP